MNEASLELLLQFVASRTGTRLSRQQRERLVAECQRSAPAGDVAAYLAALQSREGAHELARLLAVVSVHKTDLFRDEPQLEALSQHVLPQLVAERRPLSLWSAGCSTGEEVATLLVLLAEAGAHPQSTVLGSDLSAHALEQARKLAFTPEVLRRVPAHLLGRYFHDGALVPSLRARARFLQHNLMDRPYPFALTATGDGGPFDLIVCRNVLIYFTAEAARATVEGFLERLRPGGVLVLSTAEPLLEPVPGLTTLRVPGAFFYQRVEATLDGPRRHGSATGDAPHARRETPPTVVEHEAPPLPVPAGRGPGRDFMR